MSKTFRALAIAFALGIAVPGAPALAASDGIVSVKVNMARVLRINSPASTVIVGNPGVADVTIQDAQTLILTGRSYGQTNLIVLDAAGNPIADTLIEVIQARADIMTVYMGQARTTYSCTPECLPTVMIGDQPEFTSTVISSTTVVEGLSN